MIKIKKDDWKFVGWNVLAAVGLVLLVVIILVFTLDAYTGHGKEEPVPAIQGMTIEEATAELDAHDLNLVVVDSTYSHKVALGTIVEQSPVAGAMAKHGRDVYVTVNASRRQMVPLPDLRDVSVRQAQATLQGLLFHVVGTIYEPSEFRDLVLDIRRDSLTSIEPGTRLEEGSRLILVVGCGKGTEYVTVPELKGLTLSEARSALLNAHLVAGATEYDETPTDENRNRFIVYEQGTASGEKVLEGTGVNLRLSRNLERAVGGNEEDEESFF